MGAKTLGHIVFKDSWKKRQGGCEADSAWVPQKKRHKMKYIGLCGCCKVFSGSRDADGDRDVVT